MDNALTNTKKSGARMQTDFRLFVVDDEPLILTMLEGILAGNCEVETFASAAACVERLRERRPDMFIIDVNMPGLDGYALCRYLKNDPETRDLPVTFISADDNIETRLLGYEAGGEDFICKPIVPAELESKVRAARRILERKQQLHEQAGYAERTAMSAMTSMGELGVVLQFLSKSFACRDLLELGSALVDALRQYGLQGAVQLRQGEDSLSISPEGIDLPLETAVLNHVRHSGRIFQFRSRCAFNYGQVTLMVNNMPLGDAERCGRIRDNCALLAEGADARLSALSAEENNRRRQRGVAGALPRVHATLEALQGNYRRNCFELTQLMIAYQEDLAKSFIHLGLTEQQEAFISEMARGFMERMVGTQDQSLLIVGQLERLAADLENLARADLPGQAGA